MFFILKGVVLFMKTFTFGELSKDVRKHVVEYVYDSNSFLDRVENSLTDDLFYSFVVPISASFVINKENKKPVFLIDSFSFSLDKDILEYALTEEDNKLFSWLNEEERIFAHYENDELRLFLFSADGEEKENNLDSPDIYRVLNDFTMNMKERSEIIVKENTEEYLSNEAVEEFLDEFETVFLEDGTIIG